MVCSRSDGLYRRGRSAEARWTIPSDLAEETSQTLSQPARVLPEESRRTDCQGQRSRGQSACRVYLWHSMRSRVCVTVRCPSVCLSHSLAAAACAGFAAVGPAGRRYRSIAARPAPQQHGAAARRAAANAGSATFTADV